MTLKCGKTFYIHGLRELILSILPRENYRFSQQSSNNIPHSTRKKNSCEMCIKALKTPKSTNTIMNKKSKTPTISYIWTH